MDDEHQKWLRHCSYGCVTAKYYKPDNENYNGYIDDLVKDGYLERYRGHWHPSKKGKEHLEKLKELLP